MATPKASQLANRQSKRMKKSDKEYTEYSKFLSMDYDYKNGILAEGKKELYFKMRKEYGNK